MIKQNLKADFLVLLHIFIILFVIYSPFSSNVITIQLGQVLNIYMIYNRIAKEGKCPLTTLERKIRCVKREEKFLYFFVNDIVEISEKKFDNLMYSLLIIWLIFSMIKMKKIFLEIY